MGSPTNNYPNFIKKNATRRLKLLEYHLPNKLDMVTLTNAIKKQTKKSKKNLEKALRKAMKSYTRNNKSNSSPKNKSRSPSRSPNWKYKSPKSI
jgi:alpha-galactosidase